MSAAAPPAPGAPAAPEAPLGREAFRDAMALLAGAISIVTTDGPQGRAGFTASAVCSVTDSPPTLLVCLNRASSAAPAFAAHDVLCVNTVGPAHEALAMRFGGRTPMAERFAGADWTQAATGAPVLAGGLVSFDCRISARQVVGTHEVIFCAVQAVLSDPAGGGSAWFARRFHPLPA